MFRLNLVLCEKMRHSFIWKRPLYQHSNGTNTQDLSRNTYGQKNYLVKLTAKHWKSQRWLMVGVWAAVLKSQAFTEPTIHTDFLSKRFYGDAITQTYYKQQQKVMGCCLGIWTNNQCCHFSKRMRAIISNAHKLIKRHLQHFPKKRWRK